MEEGTQPLSLNNSVVQDDNSYQSHLILTDISKELMEEDNPDVVKPEAGLTEVMTTTEGKKVKTLVDTGSEVSVISEHILEELKEVNKNILSLPVAGVTIVAVSYTHLDVYKRQV